jgi:hypothetical protein
VQHYGRAEILPCYGRIELLVSCHEREDSGDVPAGGRAFEDQTENRVSVEGGGMREGPEEGIVGVVDAGGEGMFGG